MSYRNQLTEEIVSKLNALTERKKDWKAALIARSICDEHKHEIKKDSPFTSYNVYQNVRREVANVISKLATDKPKIGNLQLAIPGFEHLQSYYMIDSVGVYIDNMTDEQIDEKSKQYRSMAKACNEHADELQAYKVKRKTIANV